MLYLTGPATLSGAATGAGILELDGVTVLGDFTDASSVAQAHQVTLGDAAGDAAILTINSSGRWNLSADVGIGLGKSKASIIDNSGLLEKSGSAGAAGSVIAAAVDNTGTLAANSGLFDFAGAISGAGKAEIANGATLEFGSAVASGQQVDFLGAGVLDLADPLGFRGTIDLASSGAIIELAGSWKSLAYLATSDALTLTNATTSAKLSLTLSGDYASSDFTLSHTGAGASAVTKITFTSWWS